MISIYDKRNRPRSSSAVEPIAPKPTGRHLVMLTARVTGPVRVWSMTHEGASLGMLVGTATWLWLAGIDAILGTPFHTFRVLGGITLFTVLHYVACIAYGIALTAMVRAAMEEPSLLLAVVFGSILLEVGMAMLTVVISASELGSLAWAGVFIGSLIGAALALVILARRYPIVEMLRHAQEDT